MNRIGNGQQINNVCLKFTLWFEVVGENIYINEFLTDAKNKKLLKKIQLVYTLSCDFNYASIYVICIF